MCVAATVLKTPLRERWLTALVVFLVLALPALFSALLRGVRAALAGHSPLTSATDAYGRLTPLTSATSIAAGRVATAAVFAYVLLRIWHEFKHNYSPSVCCAPCSMLVCYAVLLSKRKRASRPVPLWLSPITAGFKAHRQRTPQLLFLRKIGVIVIALTVTDQLITACALTVLAAVTFHYLFKTHPINAVNGGSALLQSQLLVTIVPVCVV